MADAQSARPNTSSLTTRPSRWAGRTPQELMGNCPFQVTHDLIIPTLWSIPVPTAEEEEDLGRDLDIWTTTWTAKMIHDYHTGMTADDELFYEFQQDFEGWTLDFFQAIDKQTIKSLKAVLRQRGVYTGRANLNVPNALFNLLQSEEPLQWHEGELRATDLHPRSKARLQVTPSPEILPTPTQEEPLLSTPQQQQQPRLTTSEMRFAESTRRLHEEQQRTSHERSLHASQQPRWTQTSPPPVNVASIAPVNRDSMAPEEPFDYYRSLPRQGIEYGREKLDVKTITAFTRIFDATDKYTGEVYDLLDDKVLLFLSICDDTGISPSQFHAVFPRTLAAKARDFQLHHIPRTDDFGQQYWKLKLHFEHEVHRSHYFTDWTTTSFTQIRTANPDKTLHQVLDVMLDKLQLCQRALGLRYSGEDQLRTAVTQACRGVKELEYALMDPPIDCEQLFARLRSSVEVSVARAATEHSSQYYVDRRYNGNRNTTNFRSNNNFIRKGVKGPNPNDSKRCFICKKEGCWSTNHSKEERTKGAAAFILDYEGEPLEPPELGDSEADDDADEQFLTATFLTNQAFLYRMSGDDIYTTPSTPDTTQFLLEDRYSRTAYQGILPDTGAANVSTVGKEQLAALQREDEKAVFDASTAGRSSIKFGKGATTTNLGTATVQTALGTIIFEVIDAPTPFLLCLRDMDRLGVYFDNTTNELVQSDKRYPVVRKWGHPWFHLRRMEQAASFLTEAELRGLHRRFGHPAVNRLHRLLEQAGHNEEGQREALEAITKACHHCQQHGVAPMRFKFKLKDEDNSDFNYEVVVDVMNLRCGNTNKNVLHAVDTATGFQAARFLPSMSAKDTWQTLRTAWIDTYLGPPDIVSHDAGTNFASAEFEAEARALGITCKQVPVEAHWSVGKIERYHRPLRRAFEIIYAETGQFTAVDAILQMAVKAINDTAGPNGLVPTLLVFGAYPRILDSPSSTSTVKRGEAIQKAMREIRKIAAERQVNNALNTRNGPTTANLLSLPLQSEVMVWREREGWQGPYKVAAIHGHDITIDIANRPVTFRSTVVKPYYREQVDTNDATLHERLAANDIPPDTEPPTSVDLDEDTIVVRPRRQPAVAYLSKKETDDWMLAIKLRSDGVITTPGQPFEASDSKEIDDLIGRGVFQFERFDATKHNGRIFKSRMVREVKGKTTQPYEKSRLVIQGFKDKGKEAVLTQSPTIQRSSQRLMLALAPSFIATYGMSTSLRDITQAYPQAHTELKRLILAELPHELKRKYPQGTIIRVIKPLYGIAEAGVHWFTTYQGHHLHELGMATSTYDPCLLITNGSSHESFGIVGMQTDDTLILSTPAFSAMEQEKLEQAAFRSKPKTTLSKDTQLEFNGCTLSTKGIHELVLTQKNQGSKLAVIDVKNVDIGQAYIEQRARGAYIASICQPEAAFDLSTSAQHKEPDEKQCAKLNKRLQWQIDNLQRGLSYMPIELSTAKLMVFVDGSFANNNDLSSQLGFIIMLVNERQGSNNDGNSSSFTIEGNTIHWSSTKCKRVTRSVLASEIYAMVNGVDIGLAIATTLQMITDQLELPPIPLVVCTDSYSLYECLVKLGSTLEKRLMIDIMALRQSYERREIAEIRWIHGDDNPADALTKEAPNKALERWVDNNQATIRIKGFVERPT
jgi:transposase InsO family protein